MFSDGKPFQLFPVDYGFLYLNNSTLGYLSIENNTIVSIIPELDIYGESFFIFESNHPSTLKDGWIALSQSGNVYFKEYNTSQANTQTLEYNFPSFSAVFASLIIFFNNVINIFLLCLFISAKDFITSGFLESNLSTSSGVSANGLIASTTPLSISSY